MKKEIICFLFLSMILFYSYSIEEKDVTADANDVMNNYKVTATFGDSRDDHFHTGVDLAATDQDVRTIFGAELVFYNKNRNRSIPYGNGNFVILQNLKKKLRVNYSHLKDGTFSDKKINYKKNEKIAVNGNTGHSTGPHLHLEVEDIANDKLLNPIAFLNIKDTISPRVEDVYFITKENEKISLVKSNKLKRGGKMFISCMDRINNSNYEATPYKITVITDGKEKGVLTFDYLKKTDDDYTLSNTSRKFEDIYINKKDYDYFLLDFYSLPDLVGLKIVVEDYFGNKAEFKKPIKILAPDVVEASKKTITTPAAASK